MTDLNDVTSVGSGAIITSNERSILNNLDQNADATTSATVLAAGAVMDTGNQSIAGAKTFTSTITGTNATFTGNVTGNVTGTISSLSNHTTNNLSEGSTNKYFLDSRARAAFTGSTGVTISGGNISIGQNVTTSSSVTFQSLTTNILNVNQTGTIKAGITLSTVSGYKNMLNIYNSDYIEVTNSNTSFYLGYKTGGGGSGSSAARNRTDDLYNTAIGTNSGYKLTYGYASGYSCLSATSNTYIGQSAGYSNSSGNYNVSVGQSSSYSNTSGSYNTCVGLSAGRLSTGSSNTFIGRDAGYYDKGSNNLALGNSVGATSTNTTNDQLYIDVRRKGTNSLIYGRFDHDNSGTQNGGSHYVKINGKFLIGSGYVAFSSGWSTYSDKSLKKDIFKLDETINDKIDMLEPVNYTLKSTGKKNVGFIAQEVKKIFPLLIDNDVDDNLSMDYSRLSTYLVKGMQEQNQKIKDLEKELKEQKQKNSSLEKYINDEIEKIRKEFLNK